MPSYLIFTYDIKDAEKYASYVEGVGPILLGLGAQILVVDTDANYLDGKGRGVNIVNRCKSEEAARNFYDSSEYAPLRAVRLAASANNSCLLAKRFHCTVTAKPPVEDCSCKICCIELVVRFVISGFRLLDRAMAAKIVGAQIRRRFPCAHIFSALV